MRSTSLRAAVPLVLALLAGCGADPADGLVGELARVADGGREPGPRLSISSVGRCSELAGAPRPCSARVAGLRERRARDVAARAGAALRARVDADALHAAGLVDLLWSDSAGKSLDRSIESLQAASRISESPAPVLADLAAAFLVRAERTGGARDLFEAAEAASDALVVDSASVAARFNLALALERIGLVDTAAEAWDAYVALDSASPWGARARDRAIALREPPPPLPPLLGPADAERFAAASPQEALYRGFDVVLAEWGEAVRADDAARAAERLAMAAALGAALVRRGGDASLADAVGAIRRVADDREATMRLAEGHATYGEGRRLYAEGRYGDAEHQFRRALGVASAASALGAWATLFRGGALGLTHRSEESSIAIEGLISRIDQHKYPSLAGRAHWSAGTLHLRGGRFESALASDRVAEKLLERAGEPEHVGKVRCSAAISEFELANYSAALASIRSALGTLQPFRASVWMHNCLSFTARASMMEGFSATARSAIEEDVVVARRVGTPIYGVEAHLQRARLRAADGETSLAAADLDSAESLVARIDDPGARGWVTADLALTKGSLLIHSEPQHAAMALDTAITFFSGISSRLLPALTLRAHAHLAAGADAAATADLDSAAGVLQQTSSSVERLALRMAMADAAAPTIDRLVSLLAARGQAREALAALERARPAFGDGPERGAEVLSPDGTVTTAFAFVGDTLFAWAIRSREVRLTRTPISREEFLRATARVQATLEGRGGATGVENELERLYGWLVAPLELGPNEQKLVVIADGEVAAVPFPALRSPEGRYLVEDLSVRFAPSLRDVRSERSVGSSGPVLLVADPAFDRAAHPELDRLRSAASEVRALAAAHPGAVVLADSAATRTAVMNAVTGASLVHYAGHAVFDDRHPERSFLLLAGRGGRITASDLATLDLRGVRLVVLSACTTLPGRRGRSGGFAGISGAVVGAGAGGVLGSLWRVDDDLTAALMSRFHTAYRASGDAAQSLRAAQLALLDSPDPALRSPAAWAGFRYAGHQPRLEGEQE